MNRGATRWYIVRWPTQLGHLNAYSNGQIASVCLHTWHEKCLRIQKSEIHYLFTMEIISLWLSVALPAGWLGEHELPRIFGPRHTLADTLALPRLTIELSCQIVI